MSPALLNGDAAHTNGHTNGHTTNGLKKPHHDGFGTRAIHVGSEPDPVTGAVIPSISLSTTYKQDGIGNHKVRYCLRCDDRRANSHPRASSTLAQETRTEMR